MGLCGKRTEGVKMEIERTVVEMFVIVIIGEFNVSCRTH